MKRKKYSKADGFEAVAKSLREFGYPDCKASMIKDTFDAMVRKDGKMPHGVIGMFAQSQLGEVWDTFVALPAE